MLQLTPEQLDQSAVNNSELAMAHLRSSLCLSAVERGGMLDDKARILLSGIIRQCNEALEADAANQQSHATKEDAYVLA